MSARHRKGREPARPARSRRGNVYSHATLDICIRARRSTMFANDTTKRYVLTIADVRFVLSGSLDVAAFSPFFQTFWHDSVTADLDCELSCRGPDMECASEPPDPGTPWSFTVCKDSCQVIRRGPTGETLYRITGSFAFDQVSIAWNPLRFADFYTSYENAWSTGLGLSLLMLRLRARGGLVLHGTAAEVDGQGILCVGISGKGKSTLARLLDAAGCTVT